MTAETQVEDDDPMMIAWKAYRASFAAENSERWARHFTVKADPENGAVRIAQPHLVGSLWAVFCAGWTAGRGQV